MLACKVLLQFLQKNKKPVIFLFFIFVIAITLRMINFRQSLYFGYDEARDAYDSQNIYLKGDLKISGPPASVFKGINHGPMYLYFIGPLFIVGNGNPYFVSFVFRLLNALLVFIIYLVAGLYFGKVAAVFSSILFAFSYEQYIYAIFTGNPSLSNLFWPVLFLGAGVVVKFPKKILVGVFFMVLAASFITQFDLILSYSFIVLIILFILLREKLKRISLSRWMKIISLGLIPIYTYPIAEIKNNFLGIKVFFDVLGGNFSTLLPGQTRFSVFWNNFLDLVRNNIVDFDLNNFWIAMILFILIFSLIIANQKNKLSIFVVIWFSSLSFLMITKGFMPFYSYAGVGIGMIVAAGYILSTIFKRNRFWAVVLLTLILISNVGKIIDQSKKGLVVEIKAQPGMLLSDELQIIDKTYDHAKENVFTIRTTTMPYKVQTVWSYLYNWHGMNKYGYLPLLEGGNTLGYPGELPVPQKGTTCFRFLIREPVRGIPIHLIENDEKDENFFSDVSKEEKIGDFILQTRKSKDNNCY